MRFLVIAVAAAFLLMPVSTPAPALSGVSLKSAQTGEFSAKKKKEKVEYMRSAAGPEPKAKKTKKAKKKKK